MDVADDLETALALERVAVGRALLRVEAGVEPLAAHVVLGVAGPDPGDLAAVPDRDGLACADLPRDPRGARGGGDCGDPGQEADDYEGGDELAHGFTLSIAKLPKRLFPAQRRQVLVVGQPLAHLGLALDGSLQVLERTLLVAVLGLPAAVLVVQARAVRPRLESLVEQFPRGLGVGLLER